jgi:hypothetical protein
MFELWARVITGDDVSDRSNQRRNLILRTIRADRCGHSYFVQAYRRSFQPDV